MSESTQPTVDTQCLFTRLGQVHEWFCDMRSAFRDLWQDGLLRELDPDIDVDQQDAADIESEADHCRNWSEEEHWRGVQRNVPAVLDSLHALTQGMHEAIAFLEAQCTVARDRLAAVEKS